MSSSPNAPGRCECDNKTREWKKWKKKRCSTEARRRGKTFWKRAKILDAANEMAERREQCTNCTECQAGQGWGRGEAANHSATGEVRRSGRCEGTVITEPKDATRADSNKIETNATWIATGGEGGQPRGRDIRRWCVWGGRGWQEKL